MEMIIVVSVVLITVAVVLVTFFAYLRNMKRQQAFPQGSRVLARVQGDRDRWGAADD